MSKLQDLTIADLKAALDFTTQLKKERASDLKSQGLELSKDHSFAGLEKLEFEIHNTLFGKVIKLRNKD